MVAKVWDTASFERIEPATRACTDSSYLTTVAYGREVLIALRRLPPATWAVVALKSLNCILVPATLKYAGNMAYLYVKPTAIVCTALVTAMQTRRLPPRAFCVGGTLVVWAAVQSRGRADSDGAASGAPSPTATGGRDEETVGPQRVGARRRIGRGMRRLGDGAAWRCGCESLLLEISRSMKPCHHCKPRQLAIG